MVEFIGQDVSSTIVRKLIRKKDWDSLKEYVDLNVLSELKMRGDSIFC